MITLYTDSRVAQWCWDLDKRHLISVWQWHTEHNIFTVDTISISFQLMLLPWLLSFFWLFANQVKIIRVRSGHDFHTMLHCNLFIRCRCQQVTFSCTPPTTINECNVFCKLVSFQHLLREGFKNSHKLKSVKFYHQEVLVSRKNFFS